MPGTEEQSHLLSKLEIDLNNQLDFKIIQSVLNLIGNIGSSGRYAWIEILDKTSLLSLLSILVEQQNNLQDGQIDQICWVAQLLAKFVKDLGFQQ